jgi:hypothetical protein
MCGGIYHIPHRLGTVIFDSHEIISGSVLGEVKQAVAFLKKSSAKNF